MNTPKMNNEPKLPTPKLSSEEISALLASKNMADWTDTVGKIMGLRKEVIPPDWEDVVVKGEMWKKLQWCNGSNGPVNRSEHQSESAVRKLSNDRTVSMEQTPTTHAKVSPEATTHYAKHPSGIECIRIAEGFNFNLGNVIKYVWRAGLKGGAIEDLKKARDYINFEIDRVDRML